MSKIKKINHIIYNKNINKTDFQLQDIDYKIKKKEYDDKEYYLIEQKDCKENFLLTDLGHKHKIIYEKGYTGPTGSTGLIGEMGEIGRTGPTGSIGSSDISGQTGCLGAIGITGPNGQIGNTGPFGSNNQIGNTGSTGPSGPTGYKGSTGLTGSSGPPGHTGETGSTGLFGSTGNTGSPGNIGNTGITGPPGYTGSTGPSGPIGPTSQVALQCVCSDQLINVLNQLVNNQGFTGSSTLGTVAIITNDDTIEVNLLSIVGNTGSVLVFNVSGNTGFMSVSKIIGIHVLNSNIEFIGFLSFLSPPIPNTCESFAELELRNCLTNGSSLITLYLIDGTNFTVNLLYIAYGLIIISLYNSDSSKYLIPICSIDYIQNYTSQEPN